MRRWQRALRKLPEDWVPLAANPGTRNQGYSKLLGWKFTCLTYACLSLLPHSLAPNPMPVCLEYALGIWFLGLQYKCGLERQLEGRQPSA